MCIRDRCITFGHRQQCDEHAHHAGNADHDDGRRAEALAQRCLLYTSDAADERSSVDLGGRRIIKKKKSVSTICLQVSYTRTSTNETDTERDDQDEKGAAQ